MKTVGRFLDYIFRFPHALISIFLILYFFPIIFQNQVLYYGDILFLLPAKKFFFASLFSGIFPLWLPNVLSGYPLFADITSGNYYLPNLLLIFSQTMKSISFLMVVHFFVAAFFMYRLGKILNLSNIASVVSSVTFSLSGLLINYIAEPSRFFVVSLYPLFFYSFLKILKIGSLFWVIITSVILSTQIFAGHVQYVLIELLFTPFFLFIDKKTKIKYGILLLLIVVILGLVLSSVSLIPAFELLPHITRFNLSQDVSVYQNFSLHPLSLTRFFLSHFWGVKNEGSAWGIMDTSSLGYIGFLPLLMIILNFKKIINNRLTIVFLIGASISLLISFGAYLPFFKIFINLVPVFKFFRNPMSFLAIYTLFTALLAGFAVDWFSLRKEKYRVVILIFSLLTITAGVVYFYILFNRNVPNSILITVAKIIQKNLSLFHTVEVDFAIAQFILLNIIIIGTLTFFGLAFRKKEVLALFIFLDLFIFTRSNFFTINGQLLEKKNPIAEYLKENLGTYRYASSSQIAPFSGIYDFYGSIAFQPPFAKEGVRPNKEILEKRLLHELTLIPPNFSMYHNLRTIDGALFILKNYNDLFKREGQLNELYQKMSIYNPYIKQRRTDTTLTEVDFSQVSFNDEIFSELAAKYIVTDRNLYLKHHQAVFSHGRITVYQNKTAKPRAYIIDSNGKIADKARILRESANSVEIKVDGKGTLVLSDVYYPGWKAYKGSKEIKIAPYNGIFRQVAVEEGDKIDFQFKPRSFSFGLAISGISYFLVLLYLLKIFLNKK